MTLHQTEKSASEKYRVAEGANSNGKRIALLTRDNVARIEAIISLDSNYRNTSNPDRKPERNKKTGEYKYIGSTRYWVEELKILSTGITITEDGHDYNHVIEYLINAIDNENSTHLNSDGIGRAAVKERIVTSYASPTTLIEALKNRDRIYSLLDLIAKPLIEREKNHFSFATKFCHYCALFLFSGTEDEDMYSIYDDVLKNALPLYIEYYLAEFVKADEYKGDYIRYIGYIDRIRSAAKDMYDGEISRNGFDHLVWYFHKGK